MNQFFNIKRFANYAAYDMRTNYKRYLIAVAIGAIGIFLLTYLLLVSNMNTGLGAERTFIPIDEISPIMAGVFSICLILFFPIFLLLSFPALSGKKSTMNYLLVPASTFEKYLLEFFIRIIVGFSLFLLIFYLMANFAIISYEAFLNVRFADAVANHQLSISIARFSFADAIRSIFSDVNEIEVSIMKVVWLFVTAWITVYLCMFSIRTLFSRFAFVKTLAVVIGGIVLYSRLAARLITNEIVDGMPTFEFVWILIPLFILTAIASLILSYYTLKRKRI